MFDRSETWRLFNNECFHILEAFAITMLQLSVMGIARVQHALHMYIQVAAAREGTVGSRS
jgi:hypothetical protein